MIRCEVVIDGKAYPCRETMGAMLRFKKETGKEVTEVGSSLDNLVAYVWCCTVSACKADGVDFDLSLQDFADKVDYDDFVKLQGAETSPAVEAPEGDDAGSEKKSWASTRCSV